MKQKKRHERPAAQTEALSKAPVRPRHHQLGIRLMGMQLEERDDLHPERVHGATASGDTRQASASEKHFPAGNAYGVGQNLNLQHHRVCTRGLIGRVVACHLGTGQQRQEDSGEHDDAEHPSTGASPASGSHRQSPTRQCLTTPTENHQDQQKPGDARTVEGRVVSGDLLIPRDSEEQDRRAKERGCQPPAVPPPVRRLTRSTDQRGESQRTSASIRWRCTVVRSVQSACRQSRMPYIP